jgi:hypothetical protein
MTVIIQTTTAIKILRIVFFIINSPRISKNAFVCMTVILFYLSKQHFHLNHWTHLFLYKMFFWKDISRNTDDSFCLSWWLHYNDSKSICQYNTYKSFKNGVFHNKIHKISYKKCVSFLAVILTTGVIIYFGKQCLWGPTREKLVRAASLKPFDRR